LTLAARLRACAFWVVTCVVFVATSAHATEPSVSVSPPASTTCVDQNELVAALVRAGIEAHAGGADVPAPEIAVRLEGVPLALSVTVARNGAETTEFLPAATCETAAEAVAAFLASTLAPAVTSAPSVAPAPAVRPTLASPLTPQPALRAEPARVAALRAGLARVEGGETPWFLGGLLAVTGVIDYALLRGEWSRLGTPEHDRVLQTAGCGMWVTGGIAALAVGPDRGLDVASGTWLGGFGLAVAGSIFQGTAFSKRVTAGGLFVSSALAFVNVAHARPLARLKAARTEIADGTPTRERTASIERDFAASDPTIPYWLVLAPGAAGAGVAAVQTLWTPHVDSELFGWDLVTFGACGAAAIFEGVRGSPWGWYRNALRRAGLRELSLGPGPGRAGLSLTGTF